MKKAELKQLIREEIKRILILKEMSLDIDSRDMKRDGNLTYSKGYFHWDDFNDFF